jgi:DNA-directed RNA polymerase specialized sigma24 family protein
MGYIIDAVEAGIEDVTSIEISEALGLSGGSVRKWKQRGFQRLRRAARKAGYTGDFMRDNKNLDRVDE